MEHGNAWVSGNAQVFGNAWVSGDAINFSDDFIHLKVYSYCITITKTFTQIGCKIKTNKEWKKIYKRTAKEENVSNTKVKFIKMMIEAGIKELNKKNSSKVA